MIISINLGTYLESILSYCRSFINTLKLMNEWFICLITNTFGEDIVRKNTMLRGGTS